VSASGTLARLREYLMMETTLVGVDRMPDETRAAARDELAQAWRKRDAAEVLRAGGQPAEALHLARESLACLRTAVAILKEAGLVTDSSLTEAIDDVERLGEELLRRAAPDGSVPSSSWASLDRLLRAEFSLEPQIGVLVLDGRSLMKLRAQRWLLGALILVAPAGLTAFLRFSLFGLDTRASSAMDDEYTADRVLDGDPDTEWVPGGSGEEWLEVRFRPRVVHSLRLLNGDLLPDRAAHDLKFEFYLHNEQRSTGHKSFGSAYPPEWISFDAGGVRCDRIRIVVTSHFGAGAALAEVKVE
jgi:hypothetical protein